MFQKQISIQIKINFIYTVKFIFVQNISAKLFDHKLYYEIGGIMCEFGLVSVTFNSIMRGRRTLSEYLL